jgi:hypothetical protein
MAAGSRDGDSGPGGPVKGRDRVQRKIGRTVASIGGRIQCVPQRIGHARAATATRPPCRCPRAPRRVRTTDALISIIAPRIGFLGPSRQQNCRRAGGQADEPGSGRAQLPFFARAEARWSEHSDSFLTRYTDSNAGRFPLNRRTGRVGPKRSGGFAASREARSALFPAISTPLDSSSYRTTGGSLG